MRSKFDLMISPSATTQITIPSNLPLKITQKMVHIGVANYTCFSFNGSYQLVSNNMTFIHKQMTRGMTTLIFAILISSFMFLGYFVYSWISCYRKKPRFEDEMKEADIELEEKRRHA
jgi:hypothetical protein